MKILYFFPYDGSFMTEWQRVQIFNEMSHYNVHFEIFNPLSYESYQQANEKLIKRLKEDKSIDLFMNCASSDMLHAETMKDIRLLSIPTLLICFDNLHAPYMHKSIAPFFDMVWLTSKETEPMFKKWGCKTVFQPYAANPFLFVDRYKQHIDRLAFIGTPYGTRSAIINELLKGDVNCDVFYMRKDGNTKAPVKDSLPNRIRNVSWMSRFPIGRKVLLSKFVAKIKGTQLLQNHPNFHAKYSLSFEEMNVAYSNYGLSLNIVDLLTTAVLKHPIQKLHLRTFEIPMSAGLEIVAKNGELENYFSADEMIFYSDKEELIDKARYYTKPSNALLCRNMKIRARERAEREHCWKRRFDVVLNSMNLSCKDYD